MLSREEAKELHNERMRQKYHTMVRGKMYPLAVALLEFIERDPSLEELVDFLYEYPVRIKNKKD